jgi:putative heme-binding domain-containing protein
LVQQLLAPEMPLELQTAAAGALVRFPPREVGKLVLASWSSYTPQVRGNVLRALLSRSDGPVVLLENVETGQIAAGEISAETRQALLQQKDEDVRQRAGKLFGAASADRQKTIADLLARSAGAGDPAHGRELFRQQCAICHRLNGEGVEVGPDLGMVSGKSREELVTAIVDPNRAIEPRYLAYTATLKNGDASTGIIASETANALALRTAGGGETSVLRAELKELTATGRSLMPEGFEQTLSAEQLADVLAFLRSL